MPEWISTKERKPEIDQEVILFVGGDYRHYIVIAVWDYIPSENRFVWHDSEWREFDDDEATHWMPLPEPPKGA